MSRAARKGNFTTQPLPGEAVDKASGSTVTVLANRGGGRVESSVFDFAEFEDVPLLWNTRVTILHELLNKATGPTLKTHKQCLRQISLYVRWFASTHGDAPTDTGGVDALFGHEIIVWLAQANIAEDMKARTVRLYRRFLEAIGVDGSCIPTNPFGSKHQGDDAAEALTGPQLRQILKAAKAEALVIRRRPAEVAMMDLTGRDPRRASGAPMKSWEDPANRLWVLRNVFHSEIRSHEEWRFEFGKHGEMRGFEGRSGAKIVSADGVTHQVGWKGHLRWLFPWADDLAPFLVLLLLRTGWNLTTASALRSQAWQAPYPFASGSEGHDPHVYVVSQKTRGRNSKDVKSKVIKAPSSTKPWSHPYQVLATVEQLTADLRVELRRHLSELMAIANGDATTQAEITRLDAIKDDLFLFKTEQAITSLAWEMKNSGANRWLSAFFERNALPISVRQLRDAPILFSYESSGQNLFVAQMVAAHAGEGTTAMYLRRRSTLNRIFDKAVDVFGHSLDLIQHDRLDISKLRNLLKGQGLSEAQVANLSDDANQARWGNRCADPTSPPPEFSSGTSAGGPCRSQDCIDGCPHARWFSDSIDHVARNLVQSEKLLDELGLESTAASSLESRVERCRELLSRWPPDAVDASIVRARATPPAVRLDLFLGAALQ